MNIALILSGGTGERFGKELPKQYHTLLGKEVIAYTIEALKASVLADVILIAAGKESLERLAGQYALACIEG